MEKVLYHLARCHFTLFLNLNNLLIKKDSVPIIRILIVVSSPVLRFASRLQISKDLFNAFAFTASVES